MIRRVIAVARILFRMSRSGWEFFRRWFLPPPFPPDPPEEDLERQRQHHQERKRRMGWIEPENSGDRRQDDFQRPIYPTATPVVTLDQPAEWSEPDGYGNPGEDHSLSSNGDDPNSGQTVGNEEVEVQVVRPSQRSQFLSEDGSERNWIRPPEGQTYARGSKLEDPEDSNQANP